MALNSLNPPNPTPPGLNKGMATGNAVSRPGSGSMQSPGAQTTNLKGTPANIPPSKFADQKRQVPTLDTTPLKMPNTKVNVEYCLERMSEALSDWAKNQEDPTWLEAHRTLAEQWLNAATALMEHAVNAQALIGDIELKQQQLYHEEELHQQTLAHNDHSHMQDIKFKDTMNTQKVKQDDEIHKTRLQFQKQEATHRMQTQKQQSALKLQQQRANANKPKPKPSSSGTK